MENNGANVLLLLFFMLTFLSVARRQNQQARNHRRAAHIGNQKFVSNPISTIKEGVTSVRFLDQYFSPFPHLYNGKNDCFFSCIELL